MLSRLTELRKQIAKNQIIATQADYDLKDCNGNYIIEERVFKRVESPYDRNHTGARLTEVPKRIVERLPVLDGANESKIRNEAFNLISPMRHVFNAHPYADNSTSAEVRMEDFNADETKTIRKEVKQIPRQHQVQTYGQIGIKRTKFDLSSIQTFSNIDSYNTTKSQVDPENCM